MLAEDNSDKPLSNITEDIFERLRGYNRTLMKWKILSFIKLAIIARKDNRKLSKQGKENLEITNFKVMEEGCSSR